METESTQEPPRKFRNQALPFPEDFMEALRKEFAGTRARVAAAIDAQKGQKITLEQARAQVARFSKLAGKTEEERKKILEAEKLG
jgi:hypothetical protein